MCMYVYIYIYTYVYIYIYIYIYIHIYIYIYTCIYIIYIYICIYIYIPIILFSYLHIRPSHQRWARDHCAGYPTPCHLCKPQWLGATELNSISILQMTTDDDRLLQYVMYISPIASEIKSMSSPMAGLSEAMSSTAKPRSPCRCPACTQRRNTRGSQTSTPGSHIPRKGESQDEM